MKISAATVLLVDDDSAWLSALGRWMTSAGFHVETAMSANAALRAVRDGQVDVIVSDIHMPRIDGLELRDALVQQGARAIPFIFVSGSLDESCRETARTLGVPHFVEKTAPIRELARLAQELAGTA